ncbi:MAG: ribonuclease HII [Candidatus Omnitrophica bacterium]|nr:ribonuclease HII [Candidatus Omnitrophota bacterium]
MRELENDLFSRGIKHIAGVDEAGRGSLAGPVVAAAVIIPVGYEFKEKIADSKKLSAKQRQNAFQEITAACDYAYAVVGEEDIDKHNILNATLKAMAQAINKLSSKPGWVLVDGTFAPEVTCPCTVIIHGESKSISIAGASIIAKVIRDNLMLEYDQKYPEYGFSGHKGYGTKLHMQAIFKYGPCPIHRKSFQPIKSLCKNTH